MSPFDVPVAVALITAGAATTAWLAAAWAHHAVTSRKDRE